MHPKFRSDLELSEHDDGGGRITFVLKDPVGASFFRLSIREYLLLRELDGKTPVEEVVRKLRLDGYYFSEEEVQSVIATAARLGLLLGTPATFSSTLLQIKEHQERFKRLRNFTSVYFLFIPLINPDKFLEKTLWLFKIFYNRIFLGAILLLSPGALYLVIKGMPEIERQYSFFFNWENLLYLWFAIVLIKLVHEFSHAYTAKLLGRYVPEMGMALLIFVPCLYCNTTDAWQLSDRRQRIAIGAAGIGAELILAVIAVYIWSFTNPGVLNSLAFYQFSVALASTLLFNGNCLIRLDGYYILMDVLGIPNLWTKARAYVRYLFFHHVLGRSDILSNARSLRERLVFGTYGVLAIVYRLGLIMFITVGVYQRFEKVVGLLLGAAAIVIFILLPIARGIAGLYAGRKHVRPNLRAVVYVVCVLLAVGMALSLPLARKSVYPCWMSSDRVQKIAPPVGAMISRVLVREGTIVEKGALFAVLDTNELELKILKKENEVAQDKQEAKILLLDEKRRGEAPQKALRADLISEEVQFLRKNLALALQGMKSPFRGVVTKLDYRVQHGLKLPEGQVIGEVASLESRAVYGLIPGDELGKLTLNDSVVTWFPIGTGITIPGRLEEIRTFSERDLKDSPFSSRFGGDIPTERKESGGSNQEQEKIGDTLRIEDPREPVQDAPISSVYICKIHLSPDNEQVLLGMSGKLVISHAPKSVLGLLVDELAKTFNKEAFF